MTDLDFYDDLDDGEFWDLEDDWDDEADPLVAGAVLGGTLGSGVGGAGAGAVFDWAEKKLGKKAPGWARDAATSAGAGLGGALGALAGTAIPWFEDGDPFEPEYMAEDIDLMEALAEEAVEAEGEDAVIAGDEMVSRSFGVMRAAPRVRPIIAVLQAKVRRILALARRNPRYRVMARLAPLALRRTAMTLMRMAAARRPISTRSATMLFGRILAGLMRTPNKRARAVRQSQLRARRHRARRGLPAPTRVRRPVYARQPVRRASALARPAYA